MMRFSFLRLVTVASVLACVASECETKRDNQTRPPGTLGESKDELNAPPSIATQGTVGSSCFVQGVRLMRVRGFGLVTGLQGRGSSGCPASVREEIERELVRFASANPHLKNLPPSDSVVDSLDTAVVEVMGEIPAGARKNRRFDVFVTAIDPATKSLVGGRLMHCDLKIFHEVEPARVLEGRALARAGGPVFINPFLLDGDNTGEPDLLTGPVIAGGENLDDRTLRLVTPVESYSMVQRMADVINTHFDTDPKTADAASATNINLTVPKQYVGREGRFLEIVLHLPVSTSPMELEARGKVLVGELGRPDAPLEDVALSLEGLGKSVLPLVQTLYTDARRHVNYYAARTGMRLGDELAGEVMARHARDPNSPFRMTAIRELGESPLTYIAAVVMQELLGDSDPRVRILAYEAIKRVDPGAIVRLRIGQQSGNFVLDVLPARGSPLIYARRTGSRRIALIGGESLALKPPLFYSSPGTGMTLSAQPDDRQVTVMLQIGNGRIGPYKIPLDLPVLIRFLGNDPEKDVDGRLMGLGLDYGAVLHALYRLGETGAIDAEVRWEEPSIEDVVGPLKPLGRPESDL